MRELPSRRGDEITSFTRTNRLVEAVPPSRRVIEWPWQLTVFFFFVGERGNFRNEVSCSVC